MNKNAASIGHSRTIVAAATVLLAVATGPIIYIAQASPHPDPSAMPSEPPAGSVVASTLIRCGLSAEALAAAGVDAAEATGMRAAILARLETHGSALTNATEALVAARATHESLRRSLDGAASQSESAQLTQAALAVANAEAALSSVVASFAEHAESPISSEKRGLLASIRGNAGRGLPETYLVRAWTDEEVVELRDALATERIAIKQDEAVPSEIAGYLAGVRSTPSIAAAIANSNSNLAAVRAALAGG
jgi:hypothetical protein